MLVLKTSGIEEENSPKGVFSDLEHNSGMEGEGEWPLPEGVDESFFALYAAKYLAETKGEQSVIFLVYGTVSGKSTFEKSVHKV